MAVTMGVSKFVKQFQSLGGNLDTSVQSKSIFVTNPTRQKPSKTQLFCGIADDQTIRSQVSNFAMPLDAK
jgi:hypothetical protein